MLILVAKDVLDSDGRHGRLRSLLITCLAVTTRPSAFMKKPVPDP